MAYVTTSQLSTRLGSTLYARLTDRVSGTTASSSVAEEIIESAEAELHAYISARYVTPLDLTANDELEEIIQSRVLDIAEYRAWKGSPFISDVPSRVHDLYRSAMDWLSNVGRGWLKLPGAIDNPDLQRDPDPPRSASSQRRFTTDELNGL